MVILIDIEVNSGPLVQTVKSWRMDSDGASCAGFQRRRLWFMTRWLHRAHQVWCVHDRMTVHGRGRSRLSAGHDWGPALQPDCCKLRRFRWLMPEVMRHEPYDSTCVLWVAAIPCYLCCLLVQLCLFLDVGLTRRAIPPAAVRATTGVRTCAIPVAGVQPLGSRVRATAP